MYDSGIAHEKVIYDYVEPNGIIKLYETHGKELFVVMVYANLSKLVDNIDTSKTPNPKYVFVQFTDKYIATDDKGIDVVQKSQFKEKLLSTLKYKFTSEDELCNLVDKVFGDLGITDNEVHNIKFRDDIRCDYLLDTSHKTPNELKDELLEIIQ